jgi:putative DNA methylase
MTYRKKLIEVALPLEAINIESAREKSIRHGHPSTLHLWWARRPLAACRAVLFASLVDDPSSWPDKFPTEAAQIAERQRLFDILGRITIETDKKGNTKQVIRGLVSWNDINDPDSGVLIAAQREIARSIAWNRRDEPPTEPEAVRRYLAENAPPVYDPFAGGGSIPLEAQRLGLEAHASDLNPVAVLINKALIEIPPKFKDMPPVNPEAQQKLKVGQWKRTQGLADDVRYYGRWLRNEAEKRIGHLYPTVTLPPEQGGGEAVVVAWLWARTVKCPNPTCGCQMPLVRSFEFSTKDGKESWGNPIIDHSQTPPRIKFEVKTGKGNIPESPKTGRGAAFNCLACGQPAGDKHIKAEGVTGRMDAQLMAIVAEGPNGRAYFSPTSEHEEIARKVELAWYPDGQISEDRRSMFTPLYGLTHFYHLFTNRQLLALTTFSDLVSEARDKAIADATAVGLANENASPSDSGTGARAYGEAIATYLGLAIGKATDTNSSLCSWQSRMDRLSHVFTRQALPMVWDFAEPNSFGGASGDIGGSVKSLCEVLDKLEEGSPGIAFQKDAASQENRCESSKIISTDPPYYDNVGYADLSDYFYIWLRRSLQSIYPTLFSTLLVPKAQELVATPYRFAGSKQKAQAFFEEGLGKAFNRMHEISHADYPLTVYYAFKQTEAEQKGRNDELVASTGWETMLEGLIKADFSIGGTWPMRSELSNRMVASGTNALASSIVLVCRPRPADAPSTTRRRFVDELKSELPDALKKLQQGNIAPVDLAQASIGPGMAIYSRYAKVLESDGSPMRVRTALQLINQTLDDFLTELEGEFDTDTRWALAWFEQYQFNEGQFGDAETLSKAKNTSIKGMVEAGILTAKAGKVQLVPREALPEDWNPAKDNRIPVWEAAQHLIRALDQNGEMGAAHLLSLLNVSSSNLGEVARDLAYRLYSICDRKGWTQEAIAYNSLVISWSEIARLALEKSTAPTQPVQGSLEL